MPDYPQVSSPPIPCPPDADPQPPALWEPRPRGTQDPHQHSWGTDLRCTGCGWTYQAVLARAKAQQEENPCI